GNPNLCGHAINDAQRVMDAANDNGVLWSKSAIEHLFGKTSLNIPPPYCFLEPVTVNVKHDLHIEVVQLSHSECSDHWDGTILNSQWKNTLMLSRFDWLDIGYLDKEWNDAAKVA